MSLIKGKVIRKIQGFYEVLSNDKIYICKLKGILKKSNNKLNCVIGDIVEFNEESVIESIYDRKNLLLRPLISNIDFVAITLAIKDPKIDFINLQKNLLWIDKQEINKILILTKIDLLNDSEKNLILSEISEQFRNIKIFCISIKTKEGLQELKTYLKGKYIVLSGPSGVGKSSLVNYILEEQVLKTGEVSEKTKKGKNTTIDTRYFEKNDIKIFDTPGYSLVGMPKFENEKQVQEYISEFKLYIGLCKFKDCVHINEPNCYIKKLVSEDIINKKRYEFYKSVIENGD
ncbi:ribosome small subunit-dependent GTPase A [Caviibacter abscessus]|uniref:ribosome small subunit-dependent GTPase A n=1 Tax=Caviibacter abscessus TaxID=1766719 RepID=UPI000834DA86|nr:ribosome small subunit-dependent GTPase A [Caviibacter abscessus]